MGHSVLLPEFLESVVLIVSSGWMFHLYGRMKYKALVFSAIYLGFPAAVLMTQAFGASALSIETLKWVATLVDFVLTVGLIWVTWHEESHTEVLVDVEVERIRAEVAFECAVRAVERADMANALADSNAEKVRHLLAEVACG